LYIVKSKLPYFVDHGLAYTELSATLLECSPFPIHSPLTAVLHRFPVSPRI